MKKLNLHRASLILLFQILFFISYADPDSTQLKRNRIIFNSATTTLYVGSFVLLNEAWYSNYEQSSFHWFDDSKEWLQVDKIGHAQAGYFITADLLYPSYRKLGYSEKQSIYMAMGVSWTFQATIELLDGFSAKWGASWSDLAANTAGIALAGFQQLAWHEQRILFKFSAHRVDYGYNPAIKQRADRIYGDNLPERILKDYNGSSFWLSANIHSFLREESSFPKWLNVSAGYGAQGMLGAHFNKWNDKQGDYNNYSNIDRYRQFYLSPDIDFRKIPIKGKAWKYISHVLNIFKMPAPALEFNKNGIKGHWLYF